jgi:hypothetical protein
MCVCVCVSVRVCVHVRTLWLSCMRPCAAIIQAGDITTANKRLNLAFCAQIFNENHGMNMTEASAKIFESFAGRGTHHPFMLCCCVM